MNINFKSAAICSVLKWDKQVAVLLSASLPFSNFFTNISFLPHSTFSTSSR